MDIGGLLFQLFTGVTKGMNLFLLAAGLSLIYGVLGVVNFAHATFYLIAAYVCFTITAFIPSEGYWLSLLLAPLAVAILGAVIEMLFFRRLYTKQHHTQLMLAWGLILVLGDLLKLIWGPEKKTVLVPQLLTGGVPIFGWTVPVAYLFSIAFASLIGLGLYIVLYRTRLGTLIRAAAADPEITSALGIAVDRLYTAVFAAACWLAGIGGVVAASLTPIYLGSDLEIILAAFIIVIIGGMGSILGSLVGSLIYGVVFALGILVLPAYALVFLYVLMVLILIFRPYGIFGIPQRR